MCRVACISIKGHTGHHVTPRECVKLDFTKSDSVTIVHVRIKFGEIPRCPVTFESSSWSQIVPDMSRYFPKDEIYQNNAFDICKKT